MSSIIASGDSYELTKVPLFQKIGNMAVSGVIYIAVAIVGVVIGVAGATYTFEQTEIEPKIKEVAKKIGEGVENIQPETVAQVAAAITDLSKTGQDVVNVVESLAEGGNAEGVKSEGGIEMSDMSKKTGLPLSVDNLTSATTGAGLDKVSGLQNAGLDKVSGLQNAGLDKVSSLQNAGLDKVSSLQNVGLDKVSSLQNVGLDKVSGFQNAGLSKVGDLKNVGVSKVGDFQNAGLSKVGDFQNTVPEPTKALEKFGSDAREQYKLRRGAMPNISKPELNFNNQLVSSGAASLPAGGGKKTKNKRTKLTKEAKLKKPRTKKCLIQKDNKMYMSFCI
jgi:hypothetical protein